MQSDTAIQRLLRPNVWKQCNLKCQLCSIAKTCGLLCYQSPKEHVSHTYQSRKGSGERPKGEQSPAGAGSARSKSNLSQNAAMQDLNGSRFFSADHCHVPAAAHEWFIKHWQTEDNSQLNDAFKCTVTPGNVTEKAHKRRVYGKPETIRTVLRGHLCSGSL